MVGSAIVVLLGATVAGVAVWRASGDTAVPVRPASPLATAAGGAATGPGVIQLGNVKPGACVTWNQQVAAGPGAARPGRPLRPRAEPPPAGRVVNCVHQHLADVVGTQKITGLGRAWPGDARVDGYAGTRCPARARAYLGYALDPAGRFATGWIRPDEGSWLRGDRKLICTVEGRTTDGSRLLASFTGPVKGADQTFLFPVGSCLVGNGTTEMTGPCSQTHTVEVTGNVHVTSDARPATMAQWQEVVGAACNRLAQAYVGGLLPLQVGSGWFPVPATSWSAGGRTVPCIVDKLDGNGNLLPITQPLGHVPPA